jgi:hypothetical protein
MWQYHINPHQSTSYNITFYAAKSSNQTMMKLLQPRRQISTAKTKCLFQELVEKERLETEVAGSDLGIWGYDIAIENMAIEIVDL